MDKLPKSAQELWSYNPEESKRLLTEAGYPSGFKVKGLVSSSNLEQQDLLNIVASYWAKIGVELELLVQEPTVQRATLFGPGTGFEVSVRTGGAIWPPAKLKNLYSNEMWNFARYSDPDFDQLYDKALATMDETKRDALFKELNVMAIDSASYIPIGGATTMTYWWPWVQNYYGENVSSFHTTAGLEAAIWIDQSLKADMGY
jgi:peptide/nickel transport system substrate-binding protein